MGFFSADKKACTFKAFQKSEAKWPKPDAKNLSEEAVEKVLHSRNCIGPQEPFYSQWAGDRVLLLDLDAKKIFTRGYKEKRGGGVPGTEFWTPLVYIP